MARLLLAYIALSHFASYMCCRSSYIYVNIYVYIFTCAWFVWLVSRSLSANYILCISIHSNYTYMYICIYIYTCIYSYMYGSSLARSLTYCSLGTLACLHCNTLQSLQHPAAHCNTLQHKVSYLLNHMHLTCSRPNFHLTLSPSYLLRSFSVATGLFLQSRGHGR